MTHWRRRLGASQRPHRIFDAVGEVIAQTGVLAGKQRRALDSTVLDDAVARQDTVTQLIAQIRRVGREVPGAAEVVAARCTRLVSLTGQDYTQTGKPRIAWDDPGARDELVSVLVNDALDLLDGLDLEAIEAEGGKAAEAVGLLALVAGQDVEPAEGSDGTDGRWRIGGCQMVCVSRGPQRKDRDRDRDRDEGRGNECRRGGGAQSGGAGGSPASSGVVLR